MFHYRHTPDLTTIERRLRSIESDLERYGRKAGRRASTGLSAAGEQIGDALSPILSEIADRIRDGGRLAGDEAARFGNQAVKLGARMGNQALARVGEEVEQRPLVTLAVALAVGVLIGMAGRRS
jgi:ElaB/YqjD/DUF883 family membrane-anchored ribosome-binding protein